MKLQSKELKEKVEGKYAKFEVGKVYEVRVDPNQDIEEHETSFTDKTTGNLVPAIRFNLTIEVEKETKIWSVSKRVLEVIINNIDKTILFNVVRGKENYSVIPIIPKE